MKRLFLSAFFLLLCLSAGTISAAAQNSDANDDHTAPSYDMKGQSLADLQVVQKKFVDLANAIPSDKLTWRPSEDSRSFAEVFLHVAGERYGILGLMGTAPPDGFDRKTFEKSTTDKARIVEELHKSWEFTQKTINGMS